MEWNKDAPFQALALTGGGFRGLFTARALQAIEENVGDPIGRHFDLTCRTLIRGIVALAVAVEVPMGSVVEVFEDHGLDIFPEHEPPSTKLGKLNDLWRHSRKPRYSTAPLREAVTKLIGKDTLLRDAVHPVWMLSIPAFIAVSFLYRWWVGLLLLFLVTSMLSRAIKTSAAQFVLEHAENDEQFFGFLVEKNLLIFKAT